MIGYIVGAIVIAILVYIVWRKKSQSIDRRFIILGERDQMGLIELILNPPGRPKLIEIMDIPENTKQEMLRAFSSYDFSNRYENMDLICCCFNENTTLSSQTQKDKVLAGFSQLLADCTIIDMPK